MADVIPFSGVTRLDLDPDVILENLKGQLTGFVITGYDTEGQEFFASTYADGGDALWLLKRCEFNLVGDMYGYEK